MEEPTMTTRAGFLQEEGVPSKKGLRITVQDTLEGQTECIASLAKTVSLLKERLQPVMNTSEESDGSSEKGEPSTYSIMGKVRENTDHIRGVESLLLNILERLNI